MRRLNYAKPFAVFGLPFGVALHISLRIRRSARPETPKLIALCFVFAQQASIANQYIAELRDLRLQADRSRFRRNLERLGELTAYEISRTMSYQNGTVQTPLAVAESQRCCNSRCWLRSCGRGYRFIRGFLMSSIRPTTRLRVLIEQRPAASPMPMSWTDNEFDIVMEYISSPDLSGRTLILIDPMLATGRSLEQVYHSLLRYGVPAQTHIAAAIASPEGVRYVQTQLPQCHLWLGAIDSHLNAHYYIVPGLGDAGDLAFGGKI